MEASASPTNEAEPTDAPSWLDEPPAAREHPLRFMWQMDAEGRFSLGSDEFTRLIGAHTAAGFGRRWSEIAEAFGLDPDGRVARAVATGSTWSGITLDWPVDGGAACRWSCRDCRSTITPESSRAIGALGFAAISTR